MIGRVSRRAWRARTDVFDTELRDAVLGIVASDAGVAIADVSIAIDGSARRGRSRVTSLTVQARGRRFGVIVKELVGAGSQATAPNARGRGGEPRPRLAGRGTFGDRYAHEHAALLRVERHFARLGDHRFETVHALGYVPERVALVTRRIDGVNLREFLRAQRDGDSLAVVERAGGWLRAFHDIPPGNAQDRHASAAALAAWISAICTFLGENLEQRRYFEDLGAELAARAHRVLPAAMPMAVAHGDFAPRNVLTGRDGRVAVIDMAAVARAPIYEDLAYFVSSIRTSSVRSLTGGVLADDMADRRVEQALLRGYFGADAIPLGPLRLYQVLVTLDKWWGTPPRLASGIVERVAARVGASVADRHFRRELERLLS